MTDQTRRRVVAFALESNLFCLANYYLKLHLFGQFNKAVLVASYVLLGVALFFIGPTLEELHKKKADPPATHGPHHH
jgi:hypothetical protein